MSVDSPLYTAWLQFLHQQLEQELQNPSLQELEELVVVYLNHLARQQQDLTQPLFQPYQIRPGDWPTPEPYNQNFQASQETIRLLCRWLQNIGDTELSLHNYLLSQYLGLKTQIRRLSSTVADLELFQKDLAAGVRVYGDSFLTADKTDATSRRDYPAAYLDLQLGAVSLPITSELYQPQVAVVKLNPESNGIPGNNQQLGITAAYNDLGALTDGRLDTWYEYEAVASSPRSQPLILDLTITLVKETLLNRLRLYLNNLGSTTWPRIKDLQASPDGKNFVSLKSEVKSFSPRINPFEVDPLATATGGLLVFYFPPRRVRHLRLVLQQPGYHFIETSSGTRYRYAIGIREIAASGVAYHPLGEFLSQPYQFAHPVRRVMLETEETLLPTADICRIQHFISPDGESWQEIQPVSGLDSTIPKVISYEDEHVTRLIYRAVLSRREDETAQAISQYMVDTTEFLPFPASPPYILALNQAPEADSVSVCLPYAGSAGLDTKLCLGVSDGAPNQFFTVPFELTGTEEVWVNKQRWQQVESLVGQGAEARVYTVNYPTRTITFGDGTQGLVPPAGFKIYLGLPPERLMVTGGEVLSAVLRHHTLPRPQDVKIYRVQPPKTVNQELLSRGATILRLTHQNLVPGVSPTFSGTALTTFQQECTYIDGSLELVNPGDYSIDYRRGVIYTKTPTPINTNCYVSYRYAPREPIADTNWTFATDRTDTLEIFPEAFHSEEVNLEDLSAQAGNLRVDLANSHLIRGRLKFSTNAGLDRELPFIDGVSEFTGIMLQQDESVPIGTVVFTLEHIPRQDYQIVFSDSTVFAREVSSINKVTAAGTYWVDYSSGEVHTYLPTAGGQVSYYYHRDITDLDRSYSVDYEKGQVHLYRPLPARVSVSYQYAHYEVEYYFTEIIPPAAYEVKTEDRQVIITDLALIHSLRQRFTGEDAIAVRYRYLVREAPSAGALQMFTPLLHRYGLRLLFKESL